jgi:hypothetical protein
MHRIANNSDWQWAKNEGNMGRLDKAMKSLDSAKTNFMQEFLIHDLASFKKKMSPDRLHTELSSFLGMKPAVQAVQAQVDRLILMHKASQ